MDKKTDIGLRIKSIRLAKGLNLREFGEEISKLTKEKKYISDSIVSRWEKGVSIPNAKRLKAIAEYGNVSINFLLYGNEISYEYIYQNIKSVNMKNNIQDKLIDFIVNYMPSSEQNTYYFKVASLITIINDHTDSNIDCIIEQMYSFISNENMTFYHHGVYLLLNEDFKKLPVQLYLTEFIYHLLIQISLKYPEVYFLNLLSQFDDLKSNIQEISTKHEILHNHTRRSKIAEFIDSKEYQKLMNKIDVMKEKLLNKNILKKQGDTHDT